MAVVVDDVVIGRTPFDGPLGVGAHSVALRGTGTIGTQPSAAEIRPNEVTTVSLDAEELGAGLRVEPTPAAADVLIDGIVVGRGAWEGPLRAGEHRVEVESEGFFRYSRTVAIAKDEPRVLDVELKQDPNATERSDAPGRAVLELDGAAALSPSLGGDVMSQCALPCTSSTPVGMSWTLHAIYQLRSGFGFGFDAGSLSLAGATHGRPTVLHATGANDTGTVDDSLRLDGVTIGASVLYREGVSIPFTVRFGMGVLFGSFRDDRTGNFTSSSHDTYAVNVSESSSPKFVYGALEGRVGWQVDAHLELNVGVALMLLAALDSPKWQDQQSVHTASDPNAPGDGPGYFGTQTLLGSTIVVFAPGIGARYEF
jgi:hypothetical protein